MDREEAALLLHRELTRYARRSRAALTSLVGEVEAYALDGPTGVVYQIEVEARWDREPGGSIRVLGSIDDGGFRSSLSPLTADFLMDTDSVVDGAGLDVTG